MSRADYLIENTYIRKFRESKGIYVGTEIEMPIINLRKKKNEKEISQKMCEVMKKKFGFIVTRTTKNDEIYQMTHSNGDTFSFDTTFNTVEFSMGKEESVNALAKRFYMYLDELQNEAIQHGYEILGTGMNPYSEYIDTHPIESITGLAKTDYLEKYTSHHNGTIFHSYSAATQTHLETMPETLPILINLLGDMLFIDAYLFSNSPALPKRVIDTCKALKKEESNVMCYRDILWRTSEAPNSGIYERNYTSLQDIKEHLKELKLFIVTDGKGAFKAIEPVRFDKYFDDANHPRKDMTCFRSLEYIAPSYFGTIEIRSTCTQPINEIFGPVAFYTGIRENMEGVRRVLDEFFSDNNIISTRRNLRDRTIKGEYIAKKDKQDKLIADIICLSYYGLKKRSKGEEIYMNYLFENRDKIKCPAIRCQKAIKEIGNIN